MSLPTLSMKTTVTTSAVLASALAVSACQQAPQYNYIEGETMGTSYHITFQQPKDVDEEQIKQSIEQRLQAINDSMSTYQEDSTISKFNRLAAGQSLTVDPYFIKVLQDSKQVYQSSGGAFDPTIMPLINLWGFGSVMTVERLQNPPSEADINSAKSLIDFDSIKLSGDQLSKNKEGVQLDFSAVAKGYGVDVIADVLKSEYKINNYMVEIGGEVATSGVNQKAHSWQIAIDAPIIDSSVSERVTIAAIRQPKSVGNLHIATSGNYRNSVIFDGKRYSHTIDPTTGQPIAGGAPSVTVAAESVSIADAWATALTAMSYEQALKSATDNDVAAMFIIPKDGKIHDEVASADDIAKNKADPQAYWQIVETPAMQAIRADTGQ
ncbi:FAD:protein FMN transferase [Psychrobacter sp. FDAARGOS_221]|uniref:FAD:protein FMN transferase n=1 Tax=Psychrobacter sp. FDAARGOS_221 TaxID=1975705 RepID=UPI000BB549A8|nr:FAD:protein FMN transferase [Psychrobacter sp. FDAARGOS_221]PNK60648.1 FAD:protein FMN transferase [Psychrobacter sp. FDAARGOS_221]